MAEEVLIQAAQQKGVDPTSAAFASHMDATDPLREHRDSYLFPEAPNGNQAIYFCGNSLGLQHKEVSQCVDGVLTKWRTQAVGGHFKEPNPWFEADELLRDDMAKIVGATRDEVIVMNSLTVNLHLMMSVFYKPTATRRKILVEVNPFPSDVHALCSQIHTHGGDPNVDFIEVGRPGENISTAEFVEAINKHKDELALVLVGAINFLTGQLYDLKSIADAAHAVNVPCGFDCAHAAGNVQLQLHDWSVDFAVWCNYKYLNGGPGNMGSAFIHSNHFLGVEGENDKTSMQLRGWWGNARESRFRLGREFSGSVGASSFQMSTPNSLGLWAEYPSIKLIATIGMPALTGKSFLLTGYMEFLFHKHFPTAVTVITPSDPARRGCQLSVRINKGHLVSTAASEAYKCGNDVANDSDILHRQLVDMGVVCDNRPPDIVRFTPAPLYNSFEDVYQLFERLKLLLKE